MKKILLVGLILLVSLFIFANATMKSDLLNYWENNGIMYNATGQGVSASVTRNARIQIIMLAQDNNIYIAFVNGFTKDDMVYFVNESRVFPYSKEFKNDVILKLAESIAYITETGKYPNPRWGYFGNYYLKYELLATEESIVISLY